MNCDRFAQETENQLLGRLVMVFIQTIYDNKIGTVWKRYWNVLTIRFCSCTAIVEVQVL